MGVLATCPECGFASPEVRCPRCNALKVVGCGGSCAACRSSCADGSCALPPIAEQPERSHEEASTAEPAAVPAPDARPEAHRR